MKAVENTNLLLLTKQATEKDGSLKIQLLVSKVNSEGDDKFAGERMRHKQGFLGDTRGDLSIRKVDFVENILFYANQGYLTTGR